MVYATVIRGLQLHILVIWTICGYFFYLTVTIVDVGSKSICAPVRTMRTSCGCCCNDFGPLARPALPLWKLRPNQTRGTAARKYRTASVVVVLGPLSRWEAIHMFASASQLQHGLGRRCSGSGAITRIRTRTGTGSRRTFLERREGGHVDEAVQCRSLDLSLSCET